MLPAVPLLMMLSTMQCQSTIIITITYLYSIAQMY